MKVAITWVDFPDVNGLDAVNRETGTKRPISEWRRALEYEDSRILAVSESQSLVAIQSSSGDSQMEVSLISLKDGSLRSVLVPESPASAGIEYRDLHMP